MGECWEEGGPSIAKCSRRFVLSLFGEVIFLSLLSRDLYFSSIKSLSMIANHVWEHMEVFQMTRIKTTLKRYLTLT